MIRIKMCGMTRTEDALYAAELGVDAIGLIFYEKSPRYVTISQAKKIVAALPPFVTTVGVFVNPNNVDTILAEIPLDLLQFHGTESAAECQRYGRPYIKTIAMKAGIDLKQASFEYVEAKALLLDTYKNNVPGGTGITFDWNLIPKHLAKPIILAGGLTIENVQTAIQQVSPYAVDVLSGIEISKGIKDHHKMKQFVQVVRQPLN